jgi:hypothetical protein
VAFESPIYRAPSVPKISRRNISSSVIRGAEAASTATTPKLQRSRFSFLKKQELKENKGSLKLESTQLDALEETNRILFEIQNQLSIDFATRIAERRQSIRGIKKQTEKEKISRKEASIESIGKFNKKVGNFFDKVTAPAKSIFQKLLDFFGIVLTGIAVNTAFTWLSDEKNRQKLSDTLQFVGKYWKEIAGVLIGLQVVSTIASLVASISTAVALLTNPIFLAAVGLVASTAATVYRDRIRKQQQEEELQKRIKKENLSQEQIKQIRETNLQLRTAEIPSTATRQGSAEMQLGILLSDWFRRKGSRSKGGTIEPFALKANIVKQYPNIIQRFSLGGTVNGQGSQNIDSVPAKLAPGEEVIRASAANLFRPLLKDINDNAGRLWISFSAGVSQMLENNKIFQEVIGKFNIQLNLFKEQLDQFATDIKTKQIKQQPPSNGSFDVSRRTKELNVPPAMITPHEEVIPRSSVKQLQPVLKQINVKKTRKTSRAPIVIPMTAPPIVQGGGDELIQPSGGTATEEPQVSSTNMMNPYMSITPQLYGIFV